MRGIAAALLFFLVLGCDSARNTADPSSSFFIRFFGTDGNQVGVDLVANDDGTFMLLGNSQLTAGGESQIYLVKVNQDGIVLWEKFYGETNSELAKDIEQLSDGTYAILSDRQKPASGTDMLLRIIGGNGNLMDSTSFTFWGISDEIGVSVTELLNGTSNAGFILAGHSNYDSIPGDNGGDGFENETALFVRLNSDLSTIGDEWTKSAGASGDDYCIKIFQVGNLTDPDPYLLFGYTNSDPNNSTHNYWATKLTAGGGGGGLNEEAGGIMPGSPPNSDEILGSITPTLISMGLNNYLLSGLLSNGSGNDDIFIAKLNTNSLSVDGILTPKVLNINLGDISSLGSNFQKVSAYPTLDLGYIIAANSFNSGNSNIVLTKVGVDGNVLWENPVIIGGAGEDYERAVYELPNGGIIVFGTMQIGDDKQSKMSLIKLNSNGEFKE